MEPSRDDTENPFVVPTDYWSESEDTPIASQYIPINFSDFTDSYTESSAASMACFDVDINHTQNLCSSEVVEHPESKNQVLEVSESESDQSTESYHGMYLEDGAWKYPTFGEPGFYESGAAYYHENWPKKKKEKPKFSISKWLNEKEFDEIGWKSSSSKPKPAED